MPLQQTISRDVLASLPEWCSYEGESEKLAQFKGKWFQTALVENLIPVGEREAVMVLREDGTPYYPWRDVPIHEVDEDGNVVEKPWGAGDLKKLLRETEGGMSTADLASAGMTDDDLDKLSRELLGEPWTPDRPGPSKARRARYDAVMAKAYA